MAHKICPICGTPSHPNAAICHVCGTTLTDVPVIAGKGQRRGRANSDYDFHHGESDLYERDLHWQGGRYILSILVALIIVACAAVIFTLSNRFLESDKATATVSSVIPNSSQGTPETKRTLTPTVDSFLFVTNTPSFPTPLFITVTPMPSPTEPPPPCIQRVAPGSDLISLAMRCGHRSLDVIDLIVEINNLSDPGLLQVGQEIEIPWPTPTVDPNAPPPEATGDTSSEQSVDSAAVVSAENDLFVGAPLTPAPFILPTATLPPGVMWHRVKLGEDIISIAFSYGADIEILSQLNPEVTFSQCDFGSAVGGPNCIVQIWEGQLLRVPAPTSTPTIPPTASGSETPTPTATPTVNIPSPLGPDDRALFTADAIVTLRWIASGSLGVTEAYRVEARDETAGIDYAANTRDLFFILPEAWQGTDGARHRYTWSVSIIDEDAPNQPKFTTQRRSFIWIARIESN